MNLAQNLGKPYLNTVNDFGFKMTGTEGNIEKVIQEASEVFYFSQTQDKYIRRLSEFVQAALNPQSELSSYFQKLGPQGKDKVAEALRFLYSETKQQLPLEAVLRFSLIFH